MELVLNMQRMFEYMQLKLLSTPFAVLKLSPSEPIPTWATQSNHFFISKTSDELSIICPEQAVPSEVEASKAWRCFRVDGDLEFEQVGVVATVSKPIADAGISLFLVSTHDRDYVFVHVDSLEKAVETYKSIGFEIIVV